MAGSIQDAGSRILTHLSLWFCYKSVYIHSPRNDIRLVTEVKVSQLVLEHLKAKKGLDTVGAVEAICAVGPHSAELLPAIRHTLFLTEITVSKLRVDPTW